MSAEYWPTFRTVLMARRPGTEVTADSLHDDLTAAQIPTSSWGALFRTALHRGLLATDWRTVPSRVGSRRGGRVTVYTRVTQRQQGRAAA